MSWTAVVVPAIIALVLVYGLCKRVDVFEEFISGAKEGLQTAVKILPALIALMTCVGMFRASGAMEWITQVMSPLMDRVGIPSEVLPLALMRPISGSGAMALYKDLLVRFEANSTIVRIASVLMGSSETTFYTIAVYFGAYKITRTRHTAVAALSADVVAFVMSALLVRMFL